LNSPNVSDEPFDIGEREDQDVVQDKANDHTETSNGNTVFLIAILAIKLFVKPIVVIAVHIEKDICISK
jgi:hypothetical protein